MKKLSIFVLVVCLTFLSLPVFGTAILKKINVELNTYIVKINGKALANDNIVYNGNVYIRADKVSDTLGKAFVQDKKSKVITIKDKVVPVPTAPAPQKAFNFKNTYWGMSKDAVKKSEKSKPFYSDTTLLDYEKQSISNMDSQVIYSFDNNKLCLGIYNITTSHTNYNLYIDDYNTLKQSLISKYGDGVESIDWSNDLFKNDSQNWGTALSMGYVKYTCRWITSGTNIALVLDGDNFNVSLKLAYADSAHIFKNDSSGL